MLNEEEKKFIQYWEANRLKEKKVMKQLLIGLPIGALFGLAAIIWGGYTLYNNNTDDEGTQSITTTAPEPAPEPAPVQPDTPQTSTIDSAAVLTPTAAQVEGGTPPVPSYKFIFRMASRSYVLKRYNDLKPSNPGLNWDTKDSVVYRLYVSIPAAPSDTARIRDSLMEWYGTKKVIIEQ